MKYIFIFTLLILSSCKTSKQLTTKTEEHSTISDKEVVDTMKYLNSNIGYSNNSDFSYSKDIEFEEIEYENIVKNDSTIVSVPKKIKRTKTKTTKNSNGEAVVIESKSDSTKITSTKTSEIKEDVKTEIKSKSKMNNSPLVRGIYLIGALLVGGYIVVKKYFPSIFVKVTKPFKSIIK